MTDLHDAPTKADQLNPNSHHPAGFNSTPDDSHRLADPILSDTAMEVLKARYLVTREFIEPSEDGSLNIVTRQETPAEMFKRVAVAVADAEDDDYRRRMYFNAFYEMMATLKFLPNSPTLSGAGIPDRGQLSACFVLPVPDSMDEIMKTATNIATIQKSGGGTGFSFGRLRQRGAPVGSTNGVAGGPVRFLKLYDAVSSSIAQGSIRHGANMGILPVSHPDILEFIECKRPIFDSSDAPGSSGPGLSGSIPIQNFNISVGASNQFMRTVTEEIDSFGDEVPPGSAMGVWKSICENAWQTGDPGLVFLDRINASRANPVPSLGPIEATNPCGEQPLYPYDSCNLGSINLAAFVSPNIENDGPFPHFNWDEFGRVVRLAVRFLDNVITINKYPIPEIADLAIRLRRIGLGVMGLADLFVDLGITYGSSESIAFAGEIANRLQYEAQTASVQLAKERGAFPLFSSSIYKNMAPRRNAALTTIAPTGTISIIAGCSSGIEPLYALKFTRSHNLDKSNPDARVTFLDYPASYQRWYRAKYGVSPADRVSYEQRDTIVLPSFFVTAHDVPPIQHVEMQATWQAQIDNAVSKTINLPNSATPDDISAIYMQAYTLGCLGITVFRDGCRSEQVMNTAQPIPAETVNDDWLGPLPPTPDPDEPHSPDVRPNRHKLPTTRSAITHKFNIEDFEGYITIGMYEDGCIGEVFMNVDKQSGMVTAFADAICTAISIGLQHGIPLSVFTRKLRGTRFEPSGRTKDASIPSTTSILDYLARWLDTVDATSHGLPGMDVPPPTTSPVDPFTFAEGGNTGRFRVYPISGASDDHPTVDNHADNQWDECPECHSTPLVREEGCEKCYSCGYSRC